MTWPFARSDKRGSRTTPPMNRGGLQPAGFLFGEWEDDMLQSGNIYAGANKAQAQKNRSAGEILLENAWECEVCLVTRGGARQVAKERGQTVCRRCSAGMDAQRARVRAAPSRASAPGAAASPDDAVPEPMVVVDGNEAPSTLDADGVISVVGVKDDVVMAWVRQHIDSTDFHSLGGSNVRCFVTLDKQGGVALAAERRCTHKECKQMLLLKGACKHLRALEKHVREASRTERPLVCGHDALPLRGFFSLMPSLLRRGGGRKCAICQQCQRCGDVEAASGVAETPCDFDEINDPFTAVGMEVDDPVGVFADAEVDGSDVDGSDVDGSEVDLDGSEVDGDDVSVGGAFKALVLHNDDDEEEDDEQEQERQGGSEANDGDARHDLINQNINMRVDAHADADADADGPSVQLQRAGKGKKKEKKEGLLGRIRREKIEAYCQGGALCTEYEKELRIGAEKRRSNSSSSTVARHAHMLADSVVDDILLAKMLAAERGGTRRSSGDTVADRFDSQGAALRGSSEPRGF